MPLPEYRKQHLAVTDSDARRNFHDLQDLAGELWDAGRDTFDIAQTLAIHESQAAYLVSEHRASRRRRSS